MKLPAALSAAALITLAVVFGASSGTSTGVEIARLNEDNWEQFVPGGKEVDAIYGDLVLRNQHLTAVIAEPLSTRDANMTVGDVGGALIDLTVRDEAGDQLSAFYPGRRKYPFRNWKVVGIDGKEAELSEEGVSSMEAGAVVVSSEGGEGRPAVSVTYRLEPDARHLTVTTQYSNSGDEPLTVPLEDDIRADGQKEDMTKSPNGVADLFWIHDRYWRQAYGVDAPGMRIQSNSGSRRSVLKYQNEAGEDSVTLQPGESFELTRRVFPGGNLLDVKAVAEQLKNRSVHPVEFVVRDGNGRGIPRARIEVSRKGDVRGTATTDLDGQVETELPQGKYEVQVTAMGVGVGGEEIDVKGSEEPQPFLFDLEKYRPGKVVAEITDSNGNPIPCKVEFSAQEGTPQPDFGPDSAAYSVRNLRYTPLGRFQQELPPGRYDVTVSHGPEYDAIFTELTVPPAETVSLEGELVRSVHTPGWISSDFHSHSSPSGDNTSSQLGRVLNLVCEHLEFAPCTEHNRISSYQPHIERLKIGKFISTVSGIELTGRPLPLNHQNAFPLELKPRTQDGGAPQTDSDPERQFERLALWDDRSEKLLQQNHPDIGWLFYDKNGDGEPDSGYSRSFPLMDVMEIHPIQNALRLTPYETLPGRKGNNRVFNWLQLLNQGFRIYGVVNTDAHYNYHGSGGLRNWIQSPTDDPAQIEPMEIVRAAEEGRLILSNGPYLEIEASEAGKAKAVTAGEDLRASSGKLHLQVCVQCPNWFDIDRVFVLVNGRIHSEHDYSRKEHANRFRNSVVKFDERLKLELESDAHLVVVIGGEESELGPVMGSSWGKQQPVALSNPIFVDVDGDGFQANRDTLGHPLPVKFGSRE